MPSIINDPQPEGNGDAQDLLAAVLPPPNWALIDAVAARLGLWPAPSRDGAR